MENGKKIFAYNNIKMFQENLQKLNNQNLMIVMLVVCFK